MWTNHDQQRYAQQLVQAIVLNGESRSVADGMTVDALVRELGLAPAEVAVERNRQIVPRDRYATTTLVAGDNLEVVTFVGGG